MSFLNKTYFIGTIYNYVDRFKIGFENASNIHLNIFGLTLNKLFSAAGVMPNIKYLL